MVRCIYCRHFDRRTRYCNYYDVTIKLADIHKSMRCDGYNSPDSKPSITASAMWKARVLYDKIPKR